MSKKKCLWTFGILAAIVLSFSVAFSAYQHMNENDSKNFLAVHPGKAGTKLDSCTLCHSGGTDSSNPSKPVQYGSCQWCHFVTNYGKLDKPTIPNTFADTLNQYGKDYQAQGRNENAIRAIDAGNWDSDQDGYTNAQEVAANTYPGDASDNPSKVAAPAHIYTRAQLEAMPQHTQFLLMNTSKSGDYYAEYTGVIVEDLLTQAGILPVASQIKVISPDGFSTTHPLAPSTGASLYHVNGVYPGDVFHYNPTADAAFGGWCNYSAPSCAERIDGEPIDVPGGLRLLLAFQRDGAYLSPGVLNLQNKLDGEGPFRVVPPQKNPGPPDQPSTNSNPLLLWPYNGNWDHNAGFSSRTVTMIKVEPLPPGTTDINVLEAGWGFVDQNKIIIYGALDGSDSNGNGILDDEEGTDITADLDRDGIPDFQDPDTATFPSAYGRGKIWMHTSAGDFANMQVLPIEAPSIPTKGLPPSYSFPWGGIKYDIAGLEPGETVAVTLILPTYFGTKDARYYGVNVKDGWQLIPFKGENWGNTIVVRLTDGDPATDADGEKNGIISIIGAVATPVWPGGQSFTISASDGAFGIMLPTGQVKVGRGACQVFEISPMSGYKVQQVVVDGKLVGPVSTYKFINVDRNHFIDAYFEPVNPYTGPWYTISAADGPFGIMVPTGAVKVLPGKNQTFDIAPQSGHKIANVIVDGKSIGPVNSYTFFNVRGNHNIYAEFAPY